jgi:hypothetical protein
VNQAERAAGQRDERVAVREREQREEKDYAEANQTRRLIGLELFSHDAALVDKNAKQVR